MFDAIAAIVVGVMLGITIAYVTGFLWSMFFGTLSLLFKGATPGYAIPPESFCEVVKISVLWPYFARGWLRK